jgi:hypothetical protein
MGLPVLVGVLAVAAALVEIVAGAVMVPGVAHTAAGLVLAVSFRVFVRLGQMGFMTVAPEQAVQFVLFGRELLAHFHLHKQGICDGTVYSNP